VLITKLINNVAKAHGLSFLLHNTVNCALLWHWLTKHHFSPSFIRIIV
jgi:hypothetical protein